MSDDNLPELPLMTDRDWCAMGFPWAMRSDCEALGLPYGTERPPIDPTTGEPWEFIDDASS